MQVGRRTIGNKAPNVTVGQPHRGMLRLCAHTSELLQQEKEVGISTELLLLSYGLSSGTQMNEFPDTSDSLCLLEKQSLEAQGKHQ